MARIVLTIQDTENGDLDVKFTSDTPLPENYEEWSMAQIFTAKLHDTIDFIFNEAKDK